MAARGPQADRLPAMPRTYTMVIGGGSGWVDRPEEWLAQDPLVQGLWLGRRHLLCRRSARLGIGPVQGEPVSFILVEPTPPVPQEPDHALCPLLVMGRVAHQVSHGDRDRRRLTGGAACPVEKGRQPPQHMLPTAIIADSSEREDRVVPNGSISALRQRLHEVFGGGRPFPFRQRQRGCTPQVVVPGPVIESDWRSTASPAGPSTSPSAATIPTLRHPLTEGHTPDRSRSPSMPRFTAASTAHSKV